MKKFSIFLALALCVCFSVALSASSVEAPENSQESEPVEPDVILDNEDVILDDDIEPLPADTDIPAPAPDESAPLPTEPTPLPVQTPITVDNSAVVQSIQGLQQSLLSNQSPAFDNMTLLSHLELFGLELVEQTEDFALLFFSRSNSFVLVSHDSIVNLGVFQ